MLEVDLSTWLSSAGGALLFIGSISQNMIGEFMIVDDGRTHSAMPRKLRLAVGLSPAASSHEEMGFHEGWGQCADQLAELLGSM